MIKEILKKITGAPIEDPEGPTEAELKEFFELGRWSKRAYEKNDDLPGETLQDYIKRKKKEGIQV